MKQDHKLLEELQELPGSENGHVVTEKSDKPKKKKSQLLYIIGGVVFLLLLLSAVGVSFLISSEKAKAGETPLFSSPELNTDPGKIKSPGKTEQYKAEQQNRKKNLKKEALEAERMDRIAMRWEGVYKPEESSNTSASSKVKEEEEFKDDSPASKPASARPKRSNYSKRKAYPKSGYSQTDRDKIADRKKERIYSRRVEAAQAEGPVFNTLEAREKTEDSPPIARVEAVIDGDQKIRQGQYIKFRLTEDLTLSGGEVIATNTPLMGLCEFGNSRIKAKVSQVYYKGEVLPIYMKVFDEDLIEGITYNDPRIKQREKEQIDELGYDLYDDIFSEIPYAGGFLAAGRNLARNRSREKSRKVFVTGNYRVVFQVYHRQ